MINDYVNATFEIMGGGFVLDHCRIVLRDKAVKGLSIVSVFFFTLWGYWNIYYYPSLGQWASFWGGVFIVIANTWWVTLLLKYRK